MGRRYRERPDVLMVQARLKVGHSLDPAEREADNAAEAALAGLGMTASVHHAAGGGADRLGGLTVDAGLEARINRARPGGARLEPATRDRMQSAFGADLGAVRVHTGAHADALNRALDASAFTTGSDIFFSGGAYAPATSAGMGLLAHEVAHVVQQGATVQRAVVRRAFDPKNPNPTSITAATRWSGGLANKGVFLLTGEGKKQIVAKFVDEDPRRAQMADVVLSTAGLASSKSEPYDMTVGREIIKAVRAIAAQKRLAGDDTTADFLEAGADKADQEANGVVLMKKMRGVDLADLLKGNSARDDTTDDEKKKAASSKIDPLLLLQNPTFHYNLGKLYVADGLLGSADRISHLGHGVKFNTKNFKVLADGTINTFDSDTVLLAHQQLLKHQEQDQSAERWTNWLLEGGVVGRLGIQVPAMDTQNLVEMFDIKSRQDVHAEVIATFKQLADALDWANFDLPFATFDKNFLKGIRAAVARLVRQMDALVKSATTIGGADRGDEAVDPAALKIKGEFLKTVAPDVKKNKGGAIDKATKDAGMAKAQALAEKIAPKRDIDQRAALLTTFDKTLLPIPKREGELDTTEKMGRALGRLAGSIGGASAKSQGSQEAKTKRKGAGAMGKAGLDQAYTDITKDARATGTSHRKKRAQFDIGLRRSILAVHGRAVDFINADEDIMKLGRGMTDLRPVRMQLRPYTNRIQNGGINDTGKQFQKVIDGYRNQLVRKGDADAKDDVDEAEKRLDEDRMSFEAAVDFIERQLKAAGV